MAFVNLFIESDCNISVDSKRLSLSAKDKKAVYPIEDINCVLIDNLRINCSVYAINALCESGATVIICDEKHLPSTVVLPYNAYYKRKSVLNEQVNLSKPQIKKIWQSIIKQKITVQGQCLLFNKEREKAEYLFALSKKVLSGDADNREAFAAAIYFKGLFGEDFSRADDSMINVCLNYAYAIVRSLICRHLSARGFECSLGVFHKNQLNNFNLADDIIEPYRPIIDNFIFNTLKNETTFSSAQKKKIFSIVNIDVLIGGEKHSLSNAVEKTVESLLAVYTGKSEDLLLPSLCEINFHEYE